MPNPHAKNPTTIHTATSASAMPLPLPVFDVRQMPSPPTLRALVGPLLTFTASCVILPRDYGEGKLRRYLVTEAPFSAALHASSSGVLKRTSEEVSADRFSLSTVTPAVFKYLASSSGDVIDCQSSMLRMIPASSSSSVGSGSGMISPPAFSYPAMNPMRKSSDSYHCPHASSSWLSVSVGFVGTGTQPASAISSLVARLIPSLCQYESPADLCARRPCLPSSANRAFAKSAAVYVLVISSPTSRRRAMTCLGRLGPSLSCSATQSLARTRR